MVGGPGAPGPTSRPTIIAVSELDHTYILSYQQGSCPELPESVQSTSTIVQCFNGREAQPINRGSGPSIFQSVSMGERHSLSTGAVAPECVHSMKN